MPTSESHSAKILRYLTTSERNCCLFGAVGQRVDHQLVIHFSKFRLMKQAGSSGSGLRRFRDRTLRDDRSDRETSVNLDRFIKIVHQSDAANIGDWSADCRQSGTAKIHDGRVKRLDYDSRSVLHCARKTNSHETRRFRSYSSKLENICDSRSSAIRGIRICLVLKTYVRRARSTPTAQRFQLTFLQRAAVAHQFRLEEKIKHS